MGNEQVIKRTEKQLIRRAELNIEQEEKEVKSKAKLKPEKYYLIEESMVAWMDAAEMLKKQASAEDKVLSRAINKFAADIEKTINIAKEDRFER